MCKKRKILRQIRIQNVWAESTVFAVACDNIVVFYCYLFLAAHAHIHSTISYIHTLQRNSITNTNVFVKCLSARCIFRWLKSRNTHNLPRATAARILSSSYVLVEYVFNTLVFFFFILCSYYYAYFIVVYVFLCVIHIPGSYWRRVVVVECAIPNVFFAQNLWIN